MARSSATISTSSISATLAELWSSSARDVEDAVEDIDGSRLSDADGAAILELPSQPVDLDFLSLVDLDGTALLDPL